MLLCIHRCQLLAIKIWNGDFENAKNTIDLQNSFKFRDQHDEIENKEQ